MGMLLSLAIAFVVTPWLSRLWLKMACTPRMATNRRRLIDRLRARCSRHSWSVEHGKRNRGKLWMTVAR